jgi:Ca2+-binding EF-hand superfamily protein
MVRSFPVCLALASLACASASGAEPISRSYYIDGANQIVRGHDTDRDGRLSRHEWAAMVARGFSTVESVSNSQEALADVTSLFDLYDLNRDQFIAAAELATQYLYTFDCLDLNHDGRLSDEEASHGIEGHCNPPDPRSAR